MTRNKEFKSRPPPFAGHSNTNLQHHTVRGALPFFNPTQARYDLKPPVTSSSETGLGAGIEPEPVGPRSQAQWRSRDNRKGRHAIVVEKVSGQTNGPQSSSSLRAILRGLKRMATECPYWDVSYLVAVFFTVGCGIFIACGLFYWLPLVQPSSEFSGETEIVGGVTAFVGATLFQIGAILLIFEACNENKTGCFGWELEHVFHDRGEHEGNAGSATTLLAKPDPDGCSHHHRRARPGKKLPSGQQGRRWQWWPSWHEIKTHYIHEIGWVASMAMVIGATIFYVSGICALPGIYSNMSQGLAYGLYWLTYLVGGVFFILSSVLYMLETQPNWYTPAPHLLGWHIGLWNLIGSIGWTLAASLGYCTASWCEYQSELSLTWASAAFFIGSALLWYEALDKYPIETEGKRT